MYYSISVFKNNKWWYVNNILQTEESLSTQEVLRLSREKVKTLNRLLCNAEVVMVSATPHTFALIAKGKGYAARRFAELAMKFGLTNFQIKLILLLRLGNSAGQIATALKCSTKAVVKEKEKLFELLNATNVIALLRKLGFMRFCFFLTQCSSFLLDGCAMELVLS